MIACIANPQGKKHKIVSCAECRRLKLKCDRDFPCSSCRKRGLSDLCPNASLPTRPRKHSSDIKANPSASEMTRRIRQLEDALRSLHAVHSSQPHPLLVSSCRRALDVTFGSKCDQLESPVEGNMDRLEESLGTLTIDPRSGKSSFFGQSAGMESLYHNELREESELPEVHPWSSTPFDPLRDFVLDPLSPRLPNEIIILHLEGHLPDPLRAWDLCDLYYNNAAWLYSPITRDQFQTEILVPVYSTTPPSLIDSPLTHIDVSILFMVFAIGSLLDVMGPTDSGNYDPRTTTELKPLAHEGFHQLARVALTAGVSVIEEPSISGIRSIFLMAYYHMLLDRRQTPQTVWSLASIAVSLAISIGLHRDGERWKLDPKVIEQRRALFWELNVFLGFLGESCFFIATADCMYLNCLIIGLSFGRPPQITLPFVDCKVGPDTEQSIDSDGKVVHGYSYSLHTITSTILLEVRDLVLSTNQNYRDTLALDRKLRDCAIELFGAPVGSRQIGPEVLKGPDTVATMHNFFLLALKETVVLYLHRKYFVRACSSRPEDLATSRYYPSLLAACRSAQVVADILESLLTLEPILPCRFWFFWTHSLASAIILGSVAMKHPRSVLAIEAMNSLEKILELLHQCANQSERNDRPTRALKIVTNLRERACLAMSQPESGMPTEGDTHKPDDELKVLGGHARVVSMAASRSSYATGVATPSIATGSVHSQSQSPPLMGSSPLTMDVHPSLMEDLAGVRQQDRDRDLDAPDVKIEREKLLGASPAGQSVSGPRSVSGSASRPASKLESTEVDMSEGLASVGMSASPAGIEMSASPGVGMSAGRRPPLEMFATGANVRQQQSQPYAHAGEAPVSGPVSQFEDMEGGASHPHSQAEYLSPSDPTAVSASSFIGQQQQHYAGVDGTGSDTGGVAVVDDFGNVFPIPPNAAQDWCMMTSEDYTDVCWQGFIAGLGGGM